MVLICLFLQEDPVFKRPVSHSTIWTMWKDNEELCDGHVSTKFLANIAQEIVVIVLVSRIRVHVVFLRKKVTNSNY